MYVFDLEGNGLLDTVTKIHVGVFINTEDEQDIRVFGPDQIKDMLLFMKQQPILCGHNVIGYDFPALRKLYNFDYKGVIVDTLVMSRLLYPERVAPPALFKLAAEGKFKVNGPHSIQSWGFTFGAPKLEHDDWETYTPEMRARCVGDTAIGLMLFKHLRKRMDEVKFPRSVMNRTFEFFKIVHLMEDYGWLFDKDRANKTVSLINHWMRRIERILEPRLPIIAEVVEGKADGAVNWVRKPFLKSGKYAAITVRWFPELDGKGAADGFVAGPFSRVLFRRTDINSRDEMVQFLLNSGWKPIEWNYQKDSSGKLARNHKGELIPTSPKLNYKDPFTGVTGFAGQLVAKWVQCRHRMSLIIGLLELVRPDGRISQRITGIASTGRLTHAGIVNIPGSKSFLGGRIRSLFICKEGYKLVGTDSVSCQDRALANRANDASFTEMLLNGDKSKGTDGHSMNQKAINNVLKKYNIQISRDDAKNHGYGWKFGASDRKLGSMVQKGADVGAEIRAALASVSQAQAALVERLTAEWEATAKVRLSEYGKPQLYGGYITGLDGRPVQIELPHTILVYALQSDEAIIMQYAKVLLFRELSKLGWVHGREYGFVGNIHDEFQVEVREDLAEQYAKLSAVCIERASAELGCVVLQQGDASIGKSWEETH